MCVLLHTNVLIYPSQDLLIQITSDQADQLLHNSLTWFFSRGNGYSQSTKKPEMHNLPKHWPPQGDTL